MPREKKVVYGQLFFVEGTEPPTILWEIDGRITLIEGKLPDDPCVRAEYARCLTQLIAIRPDSGIDEAKFLRYLARNGYAELKRRAAALPPAGDNIAAPMRPLMTTQAWVSPELLKLGPPTRKNAAAYARLAAADAKGK